MPKVTIKREGLTIEAEVTFNELKELVGVNTANGHKPSPLAAPLPSRPEPIPISGDVPSLDKFMASLSEKARLFISVMREHPKGIEASELAPLIGFSTANQIGGLTGPGISTMAKKLGIKPSDIYKSEIIFPGGVRKRMFYPGRLLVQTHPEPLFISG